MPLLLCNCFGTRTTSVEVRTIEIPKQSGLVLIPSRKHVFRDLRPYVCTFKGCQKSDYLFESQHEWFQHELDIHRREWFCNACDAADDPPRTYTSRQRFQEHLENTHSTLFVPAQIQIVIDRCGRPAALKQECPLCGEKHFPRLLRSHLGGHMQQIATFVAKVPDNDADGESESFEAPSNMSNGEDQASNSLDFESNPSRDSLTDMVEESEGERSVVSLTTGNLSSGKEMELLPSTHPDIPITEPIVTAAAGNTESGKEVMELLPSTHLDIQTPQRPSPEIPSRASSANPNSTPTSTSRQPSHVVREIGAQAGATGLTTASSTVEQLDYQLSKSFREFSEHSKTCRGCRNPIEQYRKKRDLCEVGGTLAAQITKLLYKKAEHAPDGAFAVEVEFKQGWESVDGLVRVIAHYNQGENTTMIRDIRQGAGWDEDMNRRENARECRYTHRRGLQSNAHDSLDDYGDPRSPFLHINTRRTQADVPPVSSTRNVNSNKNVHFDTYVGVQEFPSDS
jgi:hypothetical protein